MAIVSNGKPEGTIIMSKDEKLWGKVIFPYSLCEFIRRRKVWEAILWYGLRISIWFKFIFIKVLVKTCLLWWDLFVVGTTKHVSLNNLHCSIMFLCLSLQEQIYTGTDITTLLREIKRAQDVINKIAEMRQGMMGDALVSILNEVRNDKTVESSWYP